MLITVGTTTNFLIQYESTVSNPTLAMQRAQALCLTCEADFARLLALFDVPASAFGPSNYITSINDVRAGAFNLGYSTQKDAMRVVADSFLGTIDADLGNDGLRFLFVAEVAEILMDYRRKKNPTWNRVGSDGEGLSILMGALFYPNAYYSTGYGPRINQWLGSPDRDKPQLDWITLTEATDTNFVSFGCAILFINYLSTQLGYDLAKIVQIDTPTLEGRYDALTGSIGGGYGAFIALLDQYYPVGKTPNLKTDNPFPLLDSSKRTLGMSVQMSPSATATMIATGETEVRILGCGPGMYAYTLLKTPRKVRCSSNAIGFGQPMFTWKINGIVLPSSGGSINTTASVTTRSPSKPLQTTNTSMTIAVAYAITSDVASSELEFTLDAVVGAVDLTIELDAREQFASSDVTPAIDALTIDNETLQFEPQYYDDVKRCLDSFLAHIPRKLPDAIWRYLPDPPPDAIRVFRDFRGMGPELRRLAEVAPAEVEHITQTLAEKLVVSQATVHSLLGLKGRG